MNRPAKLTRVELQTFQIAKCDRRNVIQAIEPEAERLLLAAGGRVLRNHEGYIYEEYQDSPSAHWPTLIVYWPPNTRSVYLARSGQEDGITIFMAALLPTTQVELHLTYDYRLCFLFCPFEEFFTLRVARMRIFVENGQGEYLPATRCFS